MTYSDSTVVLGFLNQYQALPSYVEEKMSEDGQPREAKLLAGRRQPGDAARWHVDHHGHIPVRIACTAGKGLSGQDFATSFRFRQAAG